MKQSIKGFTLVEIMIVVAIIGLLAAFAIPNFVQSRLDAQQEMCINNLRMIQYSKEIWALVNEMPNTSVPDESDISPYLKGTTSDVYCPADSSTTFANSYSLNQVDADVTCQIEPVGHTL